jgi:hypothetical protein
MMNFIALYRGPTYPRPSSSRSLRSPWSCADSSANWRVKPTVPMMRLLFGGFGFGHRTPNRSAGYMRGRVLAGRRAPAGGITSSGP